MLIAILLTACMTEIPPSYGTCHLTLTLEPTSASPGETVLAVTRPLSEPYDTTLRVHGERVPVVEIVKEVDCDQCATSLESTVGFDCATDCPDDPCGVCAECREIELCGSCGACPPCESSCDLCRETASFELPLDLEPGQVEVVVANQYGSSNSASLEVMPYVPPVTDTAVPPEDSGSSTTAGDSGSETAEPHDTAPTTDSSASPTTEDTATGTSGS